MKVYKTQFNMAHIPFSQLFSAGAVSEEDMKQSSQSSENEHEINLCCFKSVVQPMSIHGTFGEFKCGYNIK